MWRSSWLLLSLLTIGLTQPVHAETTEELTKLLFQSAPTTPQCLTLSRGPKITLTQSVPGFEAFLKPLYEQLTTGKTSGFERFFHPNLRVGSKIGEKVQAILKQTYDEPLQFSVARIWAFYAPQGDKMAIACPDDEVQVTVRYGYPVQFGVWLQVMGQNELGRIFMAISPRQDQFYITGWHFQQWTQQGQDASAWIATAQDALAKGDTVKGHMAFDIAQKLLWGGEFIDYPVKEKILAERDRSVSKDQWVQLARKSLGEQSIIYIGTIMARDGAGILLREQLAKDLSTPDIQKRCLLQARKLKASGWLSFNGGLRCEYVLPGESTEKEGRLGGIYLNRNDIDKKSL